MNPKNSTLVTRDIYMSVDGAKVLGEHLSIALVVKLLLDSSVTTRCNESASRDRDAGRKHHNGFDRKGGRCRCLMMRHHLGKVSHGPRCEIENLSIILAAVATTLHCELRIMFDDPKHVSVACLRLVRDKQQRCCCGIAEADVNEPRILDVHEESQMVERRPETAIIRRNARRNDRNHEPEFYKQRV